MNGVIVDSHGNPVGFAFVTDESGRRRAIADENGRFFIQGWRGRNVTFTFRRIGFHPTRVTRDFPSDTIITLEVLMLPLVPVLEEVVVRAAGGSPALDRTGFYDRLERRLKGAGSGVFITPEEVEWRRASRTTSLMQGVPGIRTATSAGNAMYGTVLIGRGGCIMNVFVDGSRVKVTTAEQESALNPRQAAARPHDMGIDAIVPIDHVKAIEVYPAASQVPAQYATLGNACGAVLIWTKVD